MSYPKLITPIASLLGEFPSFTPEDFSALVKRVRDLAANLPEEACQHLAHAFGFTKTEKAFKLITELLEADSFNPSLRLYAESKKEQLLGNIRYFYGEEVEKQLAQYLPEGIFYVD